MFPSTWKEPVYVKLLAFLLSQPALPFRVGEAGERSWKCVALPLHLLFPLGGSCAQEAGIPF